MSCIVRGSKTTLHGVRWPNWSSSTDFLSLDRLDKQPGVHPIGIGEIPRRIIAKAVLAALRCDIQSSVGSVQLCGNQIGGCEAAVHAVKEMFKDEGTQGVLLVDATNAFNCLNRNVALQNIQFNCPEIATILINTYQRPLVLMINWQELLSEEGTTQGDPLSTPMYAISILPLIRRLANDNVQQVWYADDTTATGKLTYCKGGGTNWKCWVRLLDITQIRLKPGSLPRKNILTWLLILSRILISKLLKREGVILVHHSAAKNSSWRLLKKKWEWCFEIDNLSAIVASQPHAAYSAFTHGLFGKWTFLLRTCADIESLLMPLEESLMMKFAGRAERVGQSPVDLVVSESMVDSG